jgi:hypothetical protein
MLGKETEGGLNVPYPFSYALVLFLSMSLLPDPVR